MKSPKQYKQMMSANKGPKGPKGSGKTSFGLLPGAQRGSKKPNGKKLPTE